MRFLTFTIYAPMASWGRIAVGEFRDSWDVPSRSAVLGIVAAALGLPRDESEALQALTDGYGVAVRADSSGTRLIDYHTAQTAPASAVKKARVASRADLLSLPTLSTILSRRVYRQDVLYTVAMWERTGARWTLENLASALRTPVFTPYAGRKSAPLGAPVAPRVLDAPSLADAFRPDAPPLLLQAARVTAASGEGAEIHHDECEGFESGLLELRAEWRRDVALSRQRWQFTDRPVHVGVAQATSSQPLKAFP